MEVAQNSFNGGLLMDMTDTVIPNTVLTDCVNGTLITFDGNEFTLQNDSGNGRVETCRLKPDYIPIGLKQYGGFVYVVSQNPFTGECEIGSFPSPERNITSDEIPDNLETILSSDLFYAGKNPTTDGLQISYIKLDLGDIEKNILRPGDKFLIYLTSTNINSFNQFFSNYVTTYGDNGKRKLFSLHLARVGNDGSVTYIENIVPRYTDSSPKFFYLDSEVFEDTNLKNIRDESFYSVYNNKLNGYLAIVVEIEDVDQYSVELGNISDSSDSYNLDFSVNSSSDSYNNTYGVKVSLKDSTGTSVTGSLAIKGDSTTLDGDCLETTKVENKGGDLTYIPNKDITIEGTLNNLKKDTTYTLEVLPYSRFAFNEPLKYSNTLDYIGLLTTKSSTTWRYITEFTKDLEGEEYPKVTITYDFITRGTLNKKNKCSLLYIEFYDVWSNASLIYPLSIVPSGSSTISIKCFPRSEQVEPCFTQDEVEVTPVFDATNRGGLILNKHIINNDNYYILLDYSKETLYLESCKGYNNPSFSDTLSESDFSALGLDSSTKYSGKDVLNKLCSLSFYEGPCCIKVTPILQTDENNKYIYNNLQTQTKVNNSSNAALRYNNLYLCRICGLDIFPSENGSGNSIDENPDFKYVEYNVYNTLFTNGVFNKEYNSQITNSNKNFSTLDIKDYVELYTSGFEDFTISGSTSPTDTPNYPSLLLRQSDVPSWSTYEDEVSVIRSISSTSTTSFINNLHYGILDVPESDLVSAEFLNTPIFKDSSGYISETLSSNIVVNSATSISMTIEGNLTKTIKAKGVPKSLDAYGIGYSRVTSTSNLGFKGDLSTVLRVIVDGGNSTRAFYFANVSNFNEGGHPNFDISGTKNINFSSKYFNSVDYKTIIPGTEYDGYQQKAVKVQENGLYKVGDSGEQATIKYLKDFFGNSNIGLIGFNSDSGGGNPGGAFAVIKDSLGVASTKTLTWDDNGNINYILILVQHQGNLCILPFAFINTNGSQKEILSVLSNFKNCLYTQIQELNTTRDYWVPSTNIEYNTSNIKLSGDIKYDINGEINLRVCNGSTSKKPIQDIIDYIINKQSKDSNLIQQIQISNKISTNTTQVFPLNISCDIDYKQIFGSIVTSIVNSYREASSTTIDTEGVTLKDNLFFRSSPSSEPISLNISKTGVPTVSIPFTNSKMYLLAGVNLVMAPDIANEDFLNLKAAFDASNTFGVQISYLQNL